MLARLSEAGLLLTQDKQALNVVTLVTGETLRGSWWSHPKGQEIFAVLSSLAGHEDVLFTKLAAGKVTLVHRKLWPAFLAVALEREPWQMDVLPAEARRLLASVDESRTPVRSSGSVVKELEKRLLVHTQEVHTESGRHETFVQRWPAWAREVGVKPLKSSNVAKQQLEQAAVAIGAGVKTLPWTRSR